MAPANVPANSTLFALQPDNSDRKIARAIEISLFPLNCRRWLAGNIVDDTVDTTNFVDNAVGNLA